ncbi:alpha-1-acid glycoprotein 2-like [Diceros bicornis minor]|uniref:alpha-1-acid glycoprotein 2-like n=1 Tax=Diceros bicornis minor TaxID=77932 RepID=UPI0026ED170E|nr:alpha-1-acid glycoprotein 2-like [Diceros bicornis minor]
MALPWALAVLTLLPLLDAQSLACAKFRAAPLTDATLDRLSGKWFYIATASRNPEYSEVAQLLQAAFFYLTPNSAEDTIQLREYPTIGNQCLYESSILNVHRESRTISKQTGREHVGNVILTEDPRTFMLLYFPDDEKNMALSFYADKPEVTQEQLSEFYEAIKCKGLDKLEIIYIDQKKDQCGPLEKQHEEERKKTNEEPQEDAEQG